jgi:hypothetical protein
MLPASCAAKRRNFMTNIPRTALYCVSAVAFTLTVSNTALAQGMTTDKMSAVPTAGQATLKTIAENEKVIVYDAVSRPGDTSPMQLRSMHVVYFITGGTYERKFEDGKTEIARYKTGETKIIDFTRPYSLKNIGKTTIHVFYVGLK